jgi:thioredoxin reductase (NADPH)
MTMLQGARDAATQDGEPAVTLLGTRNSAQAYAIRDFLHRSDVPFRWIELSGDSDVRAKAGVDGLADPRLPVCLFPDGTRLEQATVRQIVERLGWFRSPARSEYDLAIYGAGPAGLSAAVYGASEGLKTVVVERFAVGGQAGSSPKIEKTTSGFQPESAAPISLSGRASRRFGSAPRSC